MGIMDIFKEFDNFHNNIEKQMKKRFEQFDREMDMDMRMDMDISPRNPHSNSNYS